MVTPFGAGIIQQFDFVYAFIFVALLTYIALGKVKSLENSSFVKGLTGVVLGLVTLTSGRAVSAISTMIPWFVVVFVIILFGLLTYQLFGIKEDAIVKILSTKEHGTVFHNWVLTIVIAIAVISLYVTFTTQPLDVPAGDAQGVSVQDASAKQGFFSTMMTPEVFGVVLILLVGLFAIFYLTDTGA